MTVDFFWKKNFKTWLVFLEWLQNIPFVNICAPQHILRGIIQNRWRNYISIHSSYTWHWTLTQCPHKHSKHCLCPHFSIQTHPIIFVQKVYNFQHRQCCLSACAGYSCCNKWADNTLIVLSFHSVCLSLFFRYKEIAGNLENTISDGLKGAPGKNIFCREHQHIR